MDAVPEQESKGLSGGWIAAILAAITGALGIVGYQAGWFDRLLGREKKPDPTVAPPAEEKKPEENARLQDRRKFEKISASASNYAADTGNYPANIYGTGDKPLLSWRVAILPQLGYKELYDKFKLDEPWDSEHNKKLIAQMPDVFATTGGDAKAGLTTAQAFEGKPGVTPRPFLVEGERKGPGIAVPDGTSNTAIIVEAADPVLWTKPQDLPFNLTGPLPKVGVNGQGVMIGTLDGYVRRYPENVRAETLRYFATLNGNELFTPEDEPEAQPSLPRPLAAPGPKR